MVRNYADCSKNHINSETNQYVKTNYENIISRYEERRCSIPGNIYEYGSKHFRVRKCCYSVRTKSNENYAKDQSKQRTINQFHGNVYYYKYGIHSSNTHNSNCHTKLIRIKQSNFYYYTRMDCNHWSSNCRGHRSENINEKILKRGKNESN